MKSIVGRRYAQALLEIAGEKNLVKTFLADFELIEEALNQSKELDLAIASPLIQAEKKAAILKDIFGSKVSKEISTFLHLIAKKGRAGILRQIVTDFKSILDDKNGIVEVDVKSAVELDKVQSDALKQKLDAYTSKNTRIRLSVDKELIGGVTVKIGDTVLDSSIRHQLSQLRESFKEGALN